MLFLVLLASGMAGFFFGVVTTVVFSQKMVLRRVEAAFGSFIGKENAKSLFSKMVAIQYVIAALITCLAVLAFFTGNSIATLVGAAVGFVLVTIILTLQKWIFGSFLDEE